MTDTPNTRTLGGVLLDHDTAASKRFVTDIAGWDDGAPARFNLVARSGQDGSYDSAGVAGARVVVIEGFVQEATVEAANGVARSLAGLRPQILYELSVTSDDLGTLTAWVRVTGAVEVTWVGDRVFTYTVQATAPDPLKYGDPTYAEVPLIVASSASGLEYPLEYPLDYGQATSPDEDSGLTLLNGGTRAYWPRMRINGRVTTPTVTLTETGASVTYNGTILEGQWLDLDLANRRVLLNGNVSVRHRMTTSGNWLAVPPGGASVTWTADAADETAQLFVWGYREVYA